MKRFVGTFLNRFIEVFFTYPQVILSLLGVGLACLGYLIHVFIPARYNGLMWALIGMVLIINGTALGHVIRKLYLGVYTDKLTALGNRSLFYVRIGIAMQMIQKQKVNNFSMAMIDVDNFKEINDSYGHLAGDAVLTELAGVFKDNIRSVDTVVRWGGEEFAIILLDADDLATQKVLERVRQAVAEFDFGVIAHQMVTVSIGFVTYPDVIKAAQAQEDANLIELFVELADQALYEAKKGKNRVNAYGA